jgi:hypothetical protein
MQMNRLACVITAAATMLSSALEPTPANDEATAPSVAAVQVVSDAGEVRGTAVLVGRDDTQGSATLYFLTSARLFRGPDGACQRISKSITVRLDETRSLHVKRNDVFSEGGGLVDVAILRATTTDARGLRPTSLVYDPPPVGGVFLLSGIGESRTAKTIPERVRFESTLLAVGDHDAATLIDCAGAPAFTADGVFGIVRECGAGRSPIISLLVMARAFLERHVPKQITETASS